MAATAATQFLPFLEPAEEEALLAAAPVRSYAPDELVFDQNVSLRAIFLIDKGAVRVERQDRGAMIPIAILGAGEFFGEMSFVDGTPTSAAHRDRYGHGRCAEYGRSGLCRPPLPLDCRNPGRAPTPHVPARLWRSVLGLTRRLAAGLRGVDSAG